MKTNNFETKLEVLEPKKEPKESIFITSRLHLYYGETHALKGIDLNIGKNAVTAIIGPSVSYKHLTLPT
ncbi:MAG: phosphate ABC transporter ATP-binding protein, partial [Bacillales bacterium]